MTDPLDRLTPLGLMVLTMLGEGDMHPYEMIRLMRLRHDDRLVSLTNGSMYHTVARLEQAGLVAEVGVDREGNRPERTTYTRTDAGAAVAAEWVRRELAGIDRPERFRVALADAHTLDRGDARAGLEERRAALAAAAAAVSDALVHARATGVPDQYLLEVERDAHLRAADLAWLDALIARLDRDEIPWGPAPEPSDRYLAQREAARR